MKVSDGESECLQSVACAKASTSLVDYATGAQKCAQGSRWVLCAVAASLLKNARDQSSVCVALRIGPTRVECKLVALRMKFLASFDSQPQAPRM